MQSNFPACLAFTLKFEGGRVNDPRDPGGRTNEGVTQRTYDAYRKKTGASARSVYAMADAERDAIYADGFWSKVGGNALPAGVDLAVFDYGVNSGPNRALKAVPTDLHHPAAAVRAICAKRSTFLHALRTWATFGHGWVARVSACEALGVKMALNAEAGVAPTAPAPAAVKATLQADAVKAKGSAGKLKQASAVAVASPVAPVAAGGSHLPLVALAIVAAVGLAVAAYFVWRASHHSARAAAFSDLAKGPDVTFNFDDYKPLIAELEKIGLPILTPIVTAAASGVAGPLGLAAPMLLNGLVSAINGALGIDADATPQQAADAIASDPDGAKDKLAAVQEDHTYLLAAAKQSDDARLAGQAQQTALLALDSASQSRVQRLWRPAMGWGFGGLVLASFVLPFVVWGLLCSGIVLPPPPALDDRAVLILCSLLGVAYTARSVDKGVTASAVKAIVAPKTRVK